jgi:ATP-dependent Clp protease ATP-binding subunit ClpA
MFERFTRSARETVSHAEAEARALGHGSIGTEHLLLGVAASAGDASRVLADNGATPETLRAAIRSPLDGEALASIGIDVDEVRRRVEASFGPGALDRGRRRRSGRVAFTAAAKKSLELSLREAIQLGDRHIGPEHVLLGLLREGSAEAVLQRTGTPVAELRAALSPAASRHGRGA